VCAIAIRIPFDEAYLPNSKAPGSSGATSQRLMQDVPSSSGMYSSGSGFLMYSGICPPAITLLMYGPSRCSPMIGLSSSPISFSVVATAACIMGSDDAANVGRMAVVPCSLCAAMAVRNASSVPSIKSCPPPPCTCRSMPPGTMYIPSASNTFSSTPSGRSSYSIFHILFPLRNRLPWPIHPFGVRIFPLAMRVILSVLFCCSVVIFGSPFSVLPVRLFVLSTGPLLRQVAFLNQSNWCRGWRRQLLRVLPAWLQSQRCCFPVH